MRPFSLIKPILPAGIFRVRNTFHTLRRLGLSKDRAIVKAFNPTTNTAIKNTRSELMPDNTLNDAKFIVDVGANEGVWSKSLLRLCTPEKIYAIEPSPEVLPTLKKNLKPFPASRIIEAAVGDGSSKTAKFNVTAHSHNASLLKPKTTEMNDIYGKGYQVNDVIEVPLITLDSATKDLERVDILKIDTQGNELEVLKNAPDTLAKTELMILEANYISHYHESNNFWDLHQFLSESGFLLMNISPPFVRDNTALWADAIYRKKK